MPRVGSGGHPPCPRFACLRPRGVEFFRRGGDGYETHNAHRASALDRRLVPVPRRRQRRSAPTQPTLEQQVATLESAVATLQAQVTALQSRLAAANNVLALSPYVTLDAGKHLVRFSGVNLQLVNGTGQTDRVNGRGNLILGYDLARDDATSFCSDGQFTGKDPCERSGQTWAVFHKTGCTTS